MKAEKATLSAEDSVPRKSRKLHRKRRNRQITLPIEMWHVVFIKSVWSGEEITDVRLTDGRAECWRRLGTSGMRREDEDLHGERCTSTAEAEMSHLRQMFIVKSGTQRCDDDDASMTLSCSDGQKLTKKLPTYAQYTPPTTTRRNCLVASAV